MNRQLLLFLLQLQPRLGWLRLTLFPRQLREAKRGQGKNIPDGFTAEQQPTQQQFSAPTQSLKIREASALGAPERD